MSAEASPAFASSGSGERSTARAAHRGPWGHDVQGLRAPSRGPGNDSWHNGPATASEKDGFGNLMLTPEQQADFVRELPEVFLPVKGGWGRMGATHVPTEKSSAPHLHCGCDATVPNAR